MNKPADSDNPRPTDGTHWSESALPAAALALVLLIGWQVISLQPARQDGGLAPREMTGCVMDEPGYLRGELFGDVQQTLDWQGDAMACDGMPKPDGAGIRLAFREHLNPEQAGLILVVALDNVAPGQRFDEEPANVTINDQQEGRFFSSLGADRCWVKLQDLVELSGTVVQTWRIDGLLFCLSALPAATGRGEVTLDELEFSGLLRTEVD